MKRELLLFCLMSSAAAIGAQTTINGVTYNAGWVTACDKGMQPLNALLPTTMRTLASNCGTDCSDVQPLNTYSSNKSTLHRLDSPHVISRVNVGKVYLKVADSMMDAYKSAPVWSDFCFDPALLVTL